MGQGLAKGDIQEWLRGVPWTLHLVLSASDLRSCSDERALNALRKMNYRLCRRLLHRRFSEKPLEQRFHWIAFAQGQRDAATRHLHVLIHSPESVRPTSPFGMMKLTTAVQSAWLSERDSLGPLLPWVRAINGAGDSRSVATYVSRYCSTAAWNGEDVHFSQ